jgi:hypothetical protein
MWLLIPAREWVQADNKVRRAHDVKEKEEKDG